MAFTFFGVLFRRMYCLHPARLIIVVSAVIAVAFPQALLAQAYNTADLILFFQNPNGDIGSDQQVMANLGDTATVFRQAFVSQSNLTNFANIGPALVEAFGDEWADTTTVWGGAGASWGNDPAEGNLQNGDPQATIYTTQRRNGVGTVGQANSSGFSFASTGGMQTVASSMIGQNGVFAAAATDSAVGGVDVIPIRPAPAQSVPLNNPFNGNSWNNGLAGNSVQQQGSTNTFGGFGPISNVEFMWDLYRAQAVNDLDGQYGLGDPKRRSAYLGTLVVDNTGNVSFIVNAGSQPETQYDSWAKSFGLIPAGDGARNADPDGDGFSNFQEFAFGTNPTIGNAALVSASTSGSNLIVTALQRTAGATSGIASYSLQTRNELTTGVWSSSGVTAANGTPVGAYTPVTYTVPRAGARGFYRLLAAE